MNNYHKIQFCPFCGSEKNLILVNKEKQIFGCLGCAIEFGVEKTFDINEEKKTK